MVGKCIHVLLEATTASSHHGPAGMPNMQRLESIKSVISTLTGFRHGVGCHGLALCIVGQPGTGPPSMRVANLQGPPDPSRALRPSRALQSPPEPFRALQRLVQILPEAERL